MNTVSQMILDWVFAVDETWFYRCNHNQIAIPKSHQSVFSCVPIRKRLLAVSAAVMVSEKTLVDPEGCQIEMSVKHEGNIGVSRNVVAHSAGSGFLVGHPRWIEKHQLEIQTAGVGAGTAGRKKIELNDGTNVTKGKGT